jgi:hypothetical protein
MISDNNAYPVNPGQAEGMEAIMRALALARTSRQASTGVLANNPAHPTALNITGPRTLVMENIAILNDELRADRLELADLARTHSSLSLQGREGSDTGENVPRNPHIMLCIPGEWPDAFIAPNFAAELQVATGSPPGSTTFVTAPTHPSFGQSSHSKSESSLPMQRTPSLTRSSDDDGDDVDAEADPATPSLHSRSSSSSSNSRVLAYSLGSLKEEEAELRKQDQ